MGRSCFGYCDIFAHRKFLEGGSHWHVCRRFGRGGYGTQWVLKGSFAIAVVAIAVALGFPPPDQWLQLARDAREAILALRTSG
jgi:hypothetical protein